MNRTLTVTILATPPRILLPNRRATFTTRGARAFRAEAAELRETARLAGVDAVNALGLSTPVFGDDAVVTVTIRWEKVRTPRYPNGRYRSRPDPDALAPLFKAMGDGLVDAGILENDRKLTLTYRQENDPDGAGETVVTIAEGTG